MLQNLSKEIRECYLRAEQCKRLAEAALTPAAKDDFLGMERRWLSLAHSYEFAERLSGLHRTVQQAQTKKNKRARLNPGTPSGRPAYRRSGLTMPPLLLTYCASAACDIANGFQRQRAIARAPGLPKSRCGK
jgi:hypothetical protein